MSPQNSVGIIQMGVSTGFTNLGRGVFESFLRPRAPANTGVQLLLLCSQGLLSELLLREI